MRIPNKYNGYSPDNRRLYNDPVTMAMVGAAAGAALKPNDPLRGAMLGATVGFTGGTALGIGATAAGGTGLTASGTALGGSLGGTTAATGTGSTLAANSVGGTLGSTGLTTGTSAALNAGANTANAGLYSLGGTSAGLTAAPIASSTPAAYTMAPTTYSLAAPAATPSAFAPSFTERLGMAGKSAYENPMMTAQALNATQGLLDPGQQSPSAPAVPVQARKQLGAYDPMAMMDPYKQSVLGGQPISLLG